MNKKRISPEKGEKLIRNLLVPAIGIANLNFTESEISNILENPLTSEEYFKILKCKEGPRHKIIQCITEDAFRKCDTEFKEFQHCLNNFELKICLPQKKELVSCFHKTPAEIIMASQKMLK